MWNSHTNQEGFFVLGGSDVTNCDLHVENDLVQTKKKLTQGQAAVFNFLQDGNTVPYAIGLLYDEHGSPNIKLTKREPVLKLKNNKELKLFLSEHLVDLVVYSRMAPTDGCTVFDDLLSNFVTPHKRQYLLREFDTKSGSLTLNRCTSELAGFLPHRFKLSYPSPGKKNDCESNYKFIIEEELEVSHLTMSEAMDIETESEGLGESCVPLSGSVSQYTSMSEDRIESHVAERVASETCPQGEIGLASTIGHQYSIDIALERANGKMEKRVVHGADATLSYRSTAHFKKEWITFIKAHLSHVFNTNVLLKTEVQEWFVFLPNSANPLESTIRCRLCHRYYDEFGLATNYKPGFANAEGKRLKRHKDDNRQMIQEHTGSSGHVKILNQLKEASESQIPTLFENIHEAWSEHDGGVLKVTSRMFRTVYAETKLNIPFVSHGALVQLQELNGVDMGIKFRHRTQVPTIVEFISNDMHETLISYIMSEPRPISIMVDEATNTRQEHFLVVLFQTLEKGVPMTYFYRNIQLGSDESARGLFNSITQAWETERTGFLDFMRQNLVGIATDGASVMTGKNNGLAKLMKDFSEQKVTAIHCMAHRVHLSTRRALDKFTYCKEFERIVNALSTFYNGHAHKRKSHLRETFQQNHIKMLELSSIFEVRWVSSELQAIKNVRTTWPMIVTDLRAISEDPQFDLKTRNSAQTLAASLLDPHFIAYMHFCLDFLEVIGHWSKSLQKSNGLFFQQYKNRDKIIVELDLLKTMNGPYMNLLLSEISCRGTSGNELPSCSLDNIYTSRILWRGLELDQVETSNLPKVTTIRDSVIESLLEEIGSYFPEGDMKSYQVLDPANFPAEQRQLPFYGSLEIIKVAKQLGYTNYDEIAHQWSNLLRQFGEWPGYCQEKETESRKFWSHVLRMPQSKLEFPSALKEFLKTLLVLPIGTADCERSFSIMGHIKSKRRGSLSPKNVDHLMRIRLNGVDSLNEFPAHVYAKKWIAKGHHRADDPRGAKKMKFDANDPDDSLLTDSDPEYEKLMTGKSTLF